jgi:hypothetical protein
VDQRNLYLGVSSCSHLGPGRLPAWQQQNRAISCRGYYLSGHEAGTMTDTRACYCRLSMVVFCGRIRDLFWRRPQTRKVGHGSCAGQHHQVSTLLPASCLRQEHLLLNVWTDCHHCTTRYVCVQGYADLSDQREDFYNRRMYRRIHVSTGCQTRVLAAVPKRVLVAVVIISICSRQSTDAGTGTGRAEQLAAAHSAPGAAALSVAFPAKQGLPELCPGRSPCWQLAVTAHGALAWSLWVCLRAVEADY